MSTSDRTQSGHRGNTRRRIQDVALKLFARRGYEQTSLREIAKHLGVTKAALYHHFKAKEDIPSGLFDDAAGPIDELIQWGMEQPRTLETKQEILRRYAMALAWTEPLFRFMHENRAALSGLRPGRDLNERLMRLYELLREPDAALTDQVRGLTALFSIHDGIFVVLKDVASDPEKQREAILEFATELIAQVHSVPGPESQAPGSVTQSHR
ncbi:TetR/AcrR family transcriptional regulator [Streptomyces sp. NBC_01378]|uniref:TetR/AcrR family transcriptional regulator n=1 Tax=Streptomyces sp. NBC_01378 TaxID=2903844 RepID=UPI0032433F2F